MSSVDELMALVEGALNARGRAAAEDVPYEVAADLKRRLCHAITTTLAEKDARIAELERSASLMAERLDDDAKDDRRRFVDECAVRIMAAGMFSENVDEDVSRDLVGLSYDAAEALALPPDPVPRRLTVEDMAEFQSRRISSYERATDWMNERLFGGDS